MSNYFSKVPDFEYVSRLPDANISDYIPVKNLFKRGQLREDIFQDLAFFTKYKVRGNDRPDNVASEFYGDSQLDWLVLVCNNIQNIYTEWPMSQYNFNEYLLKTYGTYDNINATHHYETTQLKNSDNITIVPAGLEVPSTYSITYYDYYESELVTEYPVKEVTNYQYEDNLQTDRRNIFLLKPRYLNVVLDDLELIMTYKKGSSQYKTETMKTADNIRLF
jgi:hypothetical protein